MLHKGLSYSAFHNDCTVEFTRDIQIVEGGSDVIDS